MLNFPIYVLGDASSFYSVLNSVAMVFSAKGFILATELAAALIALVACVAGALGRMAGDNHLGQHPITTPLMFGAVVAFMSIPSSVMVEDIYTGNTVKVDNIPIIISAPASLFTTGAYKLFDTANTSFQSVNGSYMGVSTSGFVMPLKLLLSLRHGIDKADPYLSASVSQFIIDCIPGSTTFNLSNSAGGYGRTSDAIQYLVDHARPSGLTNYYTAAAPGGTSMACPDAGAKLVTDAATFYNGPQFMDMVNSGVNEKNPSDPQGLFRLGDLENAITNVGQVGAAVTGSQQDARAYALNAAFYHRINDTFRCLDNTGSQAEFNTCTLALNQAFEKWKAESISNGTFFSKMMTPAIVFLQLMFFGFAPIVILYSLFKGAGSIGLYIKYLGFGIWTSSWLPFSAIIQMYIQNNVADKLAAVQAKAPGVLSPAIFDATFNDIIGTRLALASDLLAATPMLSLALLSGSIYSLSSLANKWNGQGHTDPSLITPQLESAAPVFASGSSNVNRLSGGYTVEGGAQNTISFAMRNESALQSANARREAESNSAMQQLSAVASSAVSTSFNASWAQEAKTTRSSQQGWQMDDGSVKFQRGSETAVGMSKEHAKALTDTTTSIMGMSSAVTGAFAGELMKGFKGKLTKAQAEQATQKAVADLSKNDAGFASKLFSPDEGVRADAWGQVAGVAIDVGTGLAIAAEVGTGAGAAAAPATAAAGMALRATGKGVIGRAAAKIAGASRGAAEKLKNADGSQLATLFGENSNLRAQADASAQLALKGDESLKSATSQQKKDAVSLVSTFGFSAFHGASTTNSNGDSITNSETHGKTRSDTLSNAYQEASSKVLSAERAYTEAESSGKGETFTKTFNPHQLKMDFDRNPAMVADIERQAHQAQDFNPAGWKAALEKANKHPWASGNVFDAKTNERFIQAEALKHYDPNFRLLDSAGPGSDMNADIKKAAGPDTNKIHGKVAGAEKATSTPVDLSGVHAVKDRVHVGAVNTAAPSAQEIVQPMGSPGNLASKAVTAASTDTGTYTASVNNVKATAAAPETPTGEVADAIHQKKDLIAGAAGLGLAASALGHGFKPANQEKGPSPAPGSAGNGPSGPGAQGHAPDMSPPGQGGQHRPPPPRPPRQGKR